MKIEIEQDQLDGLVRVALKRHLRIMKDPKYPPKHPEDIEYEKKLIAALKVVISHYGG